MQIPIEGQPKGVSRRTLLGLLGSLGVGGIGLLASACRTGEPQGRAAEPKDLTREVYARQLKILMDKGLIGELQLVKSNEGQAVIFSGVDKGKSGLEAVNFMWKAGVQKDGEDQYIISRVPTEKLTIMVKEDMANPTVTFKFALYDLAERHLDGSLKERDLGDPNNFINSKGLLGITIALSPQDAKQLPFNPAKK